MRNSIFQNGVEFVLDESTGRCVEVYELVRKEPTQQPEQFCGRSDLTPHRRHHWWRLPDGSYGDEGEGGTLVRCPGEQQAQGERP